MTRLKIIMRRWSVFSAIRTPRQNEGEQSDGLKHDTGNALRQPPVDEQPHRGSGHHGPGIDQRANHDQEMQDAT